MRADSEAQPVSRVMVATDRSETADRAVRYAAKLAAVYEAELLLVRVLLPAPAGDGAHPFGEIEEDLRRFAEELAGPRGRSLVVEDEDPAGAIIAATEREQVDVLVVGNVGMSGRKQFLLGNIPNRISHNVRCTITIVNTAPQGGITQDRETVREEMDEEAILFQRAWRIGRVLLRAGMGQARQRGRHGSPVAMDEAAQRLRDVLEELGPTFAKLGQILSTRPDLLPETFIRELSSLQEHVTPLTEAEVVAAMEQELGVPWEDVFESIEPEPLAAGTIAQVHRATLETGERVVVKVQRPNAEGAILEDLGLLERFADKAQNRPALRRVFDLPAIIEHLSTSLRRELDFRQEAANIERMREVLAPYPRLDVPHVYTEFSTHRLLVMEEIQGVPVREAPPGEARQEAARQLLESYYHQVMTAGFFHGDPHPGNLKWWNDRIYFLDLGMVGEMDARVRELVLLMLLAFAQKDGPFLAEIMLVLAAAEGSSRDVPDMEAFQADVQGLIERYRNVPLRDLRLGQIFQQVTAIAAGQGIRLPASLLMTGKAFAQMQLLVSELSPDLDPFVVAESFFLRNTVRQLTQGLSPQQMLYDAQKARFRLGRVLEGLEGALGARPGSHLQVDFRGTERLEETITRSSRRLAFALSLGGGLVALGGVGSAFVLRALLDERHGKGK